MGIYTPTYPGPTGNNRCPIHPSEPLAGMCGCGTFFCRKCSTSAVFCSRCNQQYQAISAGRQMAVSHPGYAAAGHAVHAHPRPLSQRLLLEIMFTLTLAAIVLITMFSLQDRSTAIETNPLISYGINAGSEPLQSSIGAFQETIRYDGAQAVLNGSALYSVSARVQSTKSYNDDIGVIIPYDFLLAWGDMANQEATSGLTWEQSNRRGTVTGTLGGAEGPNVSEDYVISHVSNSHLIPANAGIREALATVEPGDMIRIEGRLVDVKAYVNKGQVLSVNTSMSRTDQGDGACEVIFVESLRINGKTY